MTQTWFITGTSSGFGRLLTEQLLAQGHRVAATLRRPEALDDLRADAGDRLWVRQLDVTDAAAARRVVDAAFDALGTIDVVVNNAGYGVFASVEEASDEQIERVIDTNLLGSIHVIRAALPHLRAQGHGRILQVSSAGGQTDVPELLLLPRVQVGHRRLLRDARAGGRPVRYRRHDRRAGRDADRLRGALDTAPAMAAYDATPAGDVRRAIAGGAFPLDNDPEKIAAAMIASAQASPAPLRLPLGRDTYEDVRASYVRRLEELDAHRDLALSVGLVDPGAVSS